MVYCHIHEILLHYIDAVGVFKNAAELGNVILWSAFYWAIFVG